MTPTILVVTTVHSPDDTRIRDRLIRSLAGSWDVVYACREPGPSDTDGLTWLPLHGGRLVRNAKALMVLLTRSWDAAVVHDPELIPAALLTRMARRRPVVFDVHENLSAQIEAKTWIPGWLKPAARFMARLIYRLAERGLILTLAEPGYQRLFKRPHPVFPNYPNYEKWPAPCPEGDGSAVYLGDVQPARGIIQAVEACGQAGVALRVIGRVSNALASKMKEVATASGTDLSLVGPMPNADALTAITGASVGLSPLLPYSNYLHSLPSKTIEYLALGLPVVASDLPGTRAFLERWDAVWLVPPGDVAMMAEAIARSVQPETRERALGQAETVRQEFAWPSERVLAFYQALV